MFTNTSAVHIRFESPDLLRRSTLEVDERRRQQRDFDTPVTTISLRFRVLNSLHFFVTMTPPG